jgi:hypothetical protein
MVLSHTHTLFEQVGKFYMTQHFSNYRKCFHVLIKITFTQYYKLFTFLSVDMEILTP